MNLFYLDEHKACSNYSNAIQEGFIHYRVDAGKSYADENKKDCILFLLKGKIALRTGERKSMLNSGDMTFIQRYSWCELEFHEESDIIIALFENTVDNCENMNFSRFLPMRDQIKYEMLPMDIRKQLYMYLELLTEYLDSGANCIHFHEIKMKELFWLMRFYCSKLELATFFYPMLGSDYHFRNKVWSNYRKAKSIKELAELCHVSLSSFKKQFNKEFDEPAGRWMHKQMKSAIINKLANENATVSEVAYSLNFSSLSQFTRFCKKNLGCTPTEWRKVNLLREDADFPEA